MSNDNTQGTDRRTVLKLAGGAAAASGVAGMASAAPDKKVEVNVGFENDAGARAFQREADDVQRTFDFDAGTGTMSESAVTALENNPNIRYVESNGTMQALGETLPYGIDRVDAEVAHSNGETGNGADVAIIDTGIDSDHADLQANIGAGKAFAECKGRTCTYKWDDDEGHGTHCAGTVDALDNSTDVVGVSTEATLHAVKVLDKRGSGSYSDVAAGIEYTAKQGWDVASMSLGGSKSSVVEDACEYAYSNGVLLVGSAGNSGPCTDCVGYPAAEPEVIAVSATDDTDALASFSSTGSEVELAAPGVDVLSTKLNGGTELLSGTSMSCPHVSGAAAQLMANGASNTQARDTLQSSAEDIGLASNEQGNGLLDVAAALGLDSSNDL